MTTKENIKISPSSALVIAGVKQSVVWIDRLAWVSLVYLSSAFMARLFSLDELQIVGISIPIAYVSMGVLGLTLAHLFIAKHIIESCADAWINLTREDRISLYEDIVRTGGIMTKGANGYRDSIKEYRHSIELTTGISDSPTFIHYILVTLLLASFVEPEISLLALSQVCFGFAFVIVNWKIGENWIVCIGDLGTYNRKSLYFVDGTARPRSISHGSGITTISGHVGYGEFFILSMVKSIFWAMLFWVLILVPFLLVYGFLILFKKMIIDF